MMINFITPYKMITRFRMNQKIKTNLKQNTLIGKLIL